MKPFPHQVKKLSLIVIRVGNHNKTGHTTPETGEDVTAVVE